MSEVSLLLHILYSLYCFSVKRCCSAKFLASRTLPSYLNEFLPISITRGRWPLESPLALSFQISWRLPAQWFSASFCGLRSTVPNFKAYYRATRSSSSRLTFTLWQSISVWMRGRLLTIELNLASAPTLWLQRWLCGCSVGVRMSFKFDFRTQR